MKRRAFLKGSGALVVGVMADGLMLAAVETAGAALRCAVRPVVVSATTVTTARIGSAYARQP